jgi:hypothetical protein
MTKRLSVLLLSLLASAPASAATLAEALHAWTGVTPDVIGRGDHVLVQLPPSSPIPAFTARAHQATNGADQGWQLDDIALPQPTRLRNGDILTMQDQHASAWLGDHTAKAEASFSGLAIAHKGDITRLDHAHLAFDSTGGPVALAIDLDSLHLNHAAPGIAPLLPRALTLHGHTTPAGAAALSAMADGRHTEGAPLTIDNASFDIGPAHFAATGAVLILSPTDRRGHITVSADHFKDMMQQMPLDGAAAQAYPIMMVLRQMGQKQNGRLYWTVEFEGSRVLVGGIDLGPLLGQ